MPITRYSENRLPGIVQSGQMEKGRVLLVVVRSVRQRQRRQMAPLVRQVGAVRVAIAGGDQRGVAVLNLATLNMEKRLTIRSVLVTGFQRDI